MARPKQKEIGIAEIRSAPELSWYAAKIGESFPAFKHKKRGWIKVYSAPRTPPRSIRKVDVTIHPAA